MMRGAAGAQRDTGPLGPVSISALLLLIALSPLWRGGNRQAPLILLEAMALVCLVAAAWRPALPAWRAGSRLDRVLLALLFLSPLWLAAVYLLPLPAGLWRSLGGRDSYWDILGQAGIARPDWLPLSLVPDATAVSLLAGIPLMAAFLGGLLLRVSQLRAVLAVVVAIALFQVALGLLQVATGSDSFLYFGALPGRPIGTFYNANHYANYIAMALVAYIWMAWASLSDTRHAHARHHHHGFLKGNRAVGWIAGGLFLALGVLASRSRGSAIGGLGAALLAMGLALTVGSRTIHWRTAVLIVGGSLLAAVLLAGADVVISRFDVSRFTADASMRGMLASTTLEGAAHFWPWGAGWGTYASVYPKFQPPELIGYAEYAHQDYAQMLFEGGIFAAVLIAAFGYLAFQRVVLLTRAGLHNRRLRRDEMAAAMCGCALLGFLVHSLVEFNMHIPANAIVAALLAGAFLRPFKSREDSADEGEEEAAGD
jgi:hypothetical protein